MLSGFRSHLASPGSFLFPAIYSAQPSHAIHYHIAGKKWYSERNSLHSCFTSFPSLLVIGPPILLSPTPPRWLCTISKLDGGAPSNYSSLKPKFQQESCSPLLLTTRGAAPSHKIVGKGCRFYEVDVARCIRRPRYKRNDRIRNMALVMGMDKNELMRELDDGSWMMGICLGVGGDGMHFLGCVPMVLASLAGEQRINNWKFRTDHIETL